MLNKELFKEKIEELINIHGKNIDCFPDNMLKLWYNELKLLDDEKFIEAVDKAKFSPRVLLYYILINLPGYNKEKDSSVKEYVRRIDNKLKNFDDYID